MLLFDKERIYRLCLSMIKLIQANRFVSLIDNAGKIVVNPTGNRRFEQFLYFMSFFLSFFLINRVYIYICLDIPHMCFLFVFMQS
jgi:hypothetical protein